MDDDTKDWRPLVGPTTQEKVQGHLATVGRKLGLAQGETMGVPTHTRGPLTLLNDAVEALGSAVELINLPAVPAPPPTAPGPYAGCGWYIPSIDDGSWYSAISGGSDDLTLTAPITFVRPNGELEVIRQGVVSLRATSQARREGRFWVWGQIPQERLR